VGRTKHSGRGAKVLSAKISARPDARRSASLPNFAQTLAPPMTSVVVERHQPINKVTGFLLHSWFSVVHCLLPDLHLTDLD